MGTTSLMWLSYISYSSENSTSQPIWAELADSRENMLLFVAINACMLGDVTRIKSRERDKQCERIRCSYRKNKKQNLWGGYHHDGTSYDCMFGVSIRSIISPCAKDMREQTSWYPAFSEPHCCGWCSHAWKKRRNVITELSVGLFWQLV